jgi:hypothetical protein
MKTQAKVHKPVSPEEREALERAVLMGGRLRRFRKRFNRLSEDEKVAFWKEIKRIDRSVGPKIPDFPEGSLGLSLEEIGRLDESELLRIKDIYEKRQTLIDEYMARHEEIPGKIRALLEENFQIVNEIIQHSDSFALLPRIKPNLRPFFIFNMGLGNILFVIGLLTAFFLESMVGKVVGIILVFFGSLMIMAAVSRYLRYKKQYREL